MSKKLILLLIIFFLVCIAFVVIRNKYAIHPPQYASPFKLSPTPGPESIISFAPIPLSVISGKQATANVVLETKGEVPTVVQFEVAYNPNFLTNVHVIPGDFFAQPTVTLNMVNAHTGRISYAIQASGQKATKEKGTVAMIQFTPISSIQTETTLTFLPKTMIREANGGGNTLKVGYGTQVVIAPFARYQTTTATTGAMLQ